MAAVAFTAWTGFADGRNDDGSQTDTVLTGAVCSENAERLCLDAASSVLRPDQNAVFALQERAKDEADVRAKVEETATATPVPEPEPEAEPEPTPEPIVWATMTVREGDTLIDLANWFGLTPFDIAVFNSMAVDDYLLTGQTLWLPIPEEEFLAPPVAATPEPVVIAPAPQPEQPPAAIVVPPTAAPAPAPTPPPSSGSWSKEEVVEAICSLPWDCEKMVAVAACESGLRPDAVNPIGYYGLFQINYAFDGWDDPWVNASVAYYDKYLPALQHFGDGLTPWPVCRYA